MTTDTWGGLAQTIDVPCNPVPPSYVVGELHDLDSKGANAIFVQSFAQGSVKGAALLNIQSIPPAATATYTLVADAQDNTGLYGLIDYSLVFDYSRVDEWSTEWIDEWAAQPTGYTQDHKAGDNAPNFNDPNPNGWRAVSNITNGIFNTAGTITGFCFDKNDNLQPVKAASEYESRYTWIAIPDPNDPLRYLRQYTLTGQNSYGVQILINAVRTAPVIWIVSHLSGPPGYQQSVYLPNAYGPAEMAILKTKRYSNRVYGLSLEYETGPTTWFQPISPDVLSAYPAPIVTNGSHPFATYHPITQQLVWETGFVNFV